MPGRLRVEMLGGGRVWVVSPSACNPYICGWHSHSGDALVTGIIDLRLRTLHRGQYSRDADRRGSGGGADELY